MITPDPHSGQAHTAATSETMPKLTAPAPETLLQLRQLRKCFAKENGEQLVALDDLDLCIERNHHLISLIGPDGSGKSTLLQIMAGLLLPDGGTYELNLASAQGPDLGPNGSGQNGLGQNEPSQELRISSSDIGYMSQTLGLYEDISVWENLKLFSQLRDLDTSSLIDPNQASSAASQPNVPRGAQIPHEASQQSWWSKLWPFTTKPTTNQPATLSANTALDTYLTGLLTKVGLIKFKDYKAGSLSGGMKQKLALTCALSAKPKLLLLDEPTVGVDPISRRELWPIIYDYLDNYHGYCIFSSLYLEEAERSSLTIFIKEGRIIYQGDAATLKQQVKSQCFALHPAAHLSYQKLARALMINLPHSKLIRDICPRMGRIDLLTAPEVTLSALNAELQELFTLCGYELSASDYQVQARDPILEDASSILPGSTASAGADAGTGAGFSVDSHNDFRPDQVLPPDASDTLTSEDGKHVVIDVQGIRKQFGDFTAVHDSNFKVYQGEIFGLLGPNGAGKTTTFRMICALLNPSAGKILIQGLTLANAKSSVRATIGYVAQKFCLYRKLTLRQNLSYFGKSYGLSGHLLQERMDQMCQIFGLTPFLDESAASLPFGVQRSLSMACALIHRPSILFLDEATSGADPTSRRVFWQMISKLSAQGTTIIVTTHFMEEAEYCDRFLIQDQGKILILGTPDEICSPHNTDLASNKKERISIEEAFIAGVESQRAANATHGADRGTDQSSAQSLASEKASDKSTLYSNPSQANSEEDHHGYQ